VDDEFVPCRHLDYTLGKFDGCVLKSCAPWYRGVRYWQRDKSYLGQDKVQFCKLSRTGVRINGIFQCYCPFPVGMCCYVGGKAFSEPRELDKGETENTKPF
jgi:hypothetical protein